MPLRIKKYRLAMATHKICWRFFNDNHHKAKCHHRVQGKKDYSNSSYGFSEWKQHWREILGEDSEVSTTGLRNQRKKVMTFSGHNTFDCWILGKWHKSVNRTSQKDIDGSGKSSTQSSIQNAVNRAYWEWDFNQEGDVRSCSTSLNGSTLSTNSGHGDNRWRMLG